MGMVLPTKKTQPVCIVLSHNIVITVMIIIE